MSKWTGLTARAVLAGQEATFKLVRQYACDHPEATPGQVAAALGMSPATVFRILDEVSDER